MQPTSSLTEAAEKAAALLQTLQSRLRGEVPVSAEPEPKPAETQPAETKDELDRQLQEYFGAKEQASVLSDMRERVIEAVVDRILQSWEKPRGDASGALENAVVERLIAVVLERLRTGGGARKL